MSTLQKAKAALIGILLLGTVLMFLIAGNMVFAAGDISPHVHLGRGLTVFAVALAIVAWFDNRRELGPSIAVAVLFLMQSVTSHAAGPMPWVAALHPLLGAVVFVGLTHLIRGLRKPATT